MRDVISMPINYQLTSRSIYIYFCITFKISLIRVGKIVSSQRKHLIFIYETDPEKILEILPEELSIPENPIMIAQWVSCKSHGLGGYEKFDLMTQVYDKNGKKFNYQLQVSIFITSCYYLISIIFFFSLLLTSFRRIPTTQRPLLVDEKFMVNLSNTPLLLKPLKGTPCVENSPILALMLCMFFRKEFKMKLLIFFFSTGTMNYNYEPLESYKAMELLATPLLNLKFIPNCEGKPGIAQLVSV